MKPVTRIEHSIPRAKGFVVILAMTLALTVTRMIWARPAAASPASSSLSAGQRLTAGQSLVSSNGQFSLVMQSDGNLVEYSGGTTALWSTGTNGNPGAYLVLQGDANAVVYSASNTALWHQGGGQPISTGYFLQIQSDANVVIYTPGGSPVWANYASPPAGFDAARRNAATAWEKSHAGSPSYNNLCETAVENAYGTSSRFPTARDDYNAQKVAGLVHNDRNAPAGVLVFFSGDSSSGHVGIAAGDGQNYWTTDGTIHVAPYSEGLGYLGWSYAPSTW